LRIYTGSGASEDVLPRGGRLVAFQSERFEHEVLPATRERLSFTGWYRRRPLPGTSLWIRDSREVCRTTLVRLWK